MSASVMGHGVKSPMREAGDFNQRYLHLEPQRSGA